MILFILLNKVSFSNVGFIFNFHSMSNWVENVVCIVVN